MVPDASERLGEFGIMSNRYVKTNCHSKKKKKRFRQEQSGTNLLVIYEKTMPTIRGEVHGHILYQIGAIGNCFVLEKHKVSLF